jgi:hypothetical protein
MSLQKDYESPHGVIGNYWKINRDSFNIERGFRLELFKDEQAKNENKQILFSKFYKFPILDIDGNIEIQTPFTIEAMDIKNPIKIAYEWIKINDVEFTNSIDV